MKKYLSLILLLSISLFCSCTRKNTITKLKSNSSISSLLNKADGNSPVLLLIKNDECGACKIFYNYVQENYETSIAPKLPEEIRVYQISINDFKNQNMWLFHILNNYSFPTVIYIDKSNNIQKIHKGADLYAFTHFLNTLESPSKEPNSNDLKRQSILLKGYISLKEDKTITKSLFTEISKINHQKPEFISALLEGYFYKFEKIHPERITYIKKLLQESLKNSNQFYAIHQKLVDDL